MKVVILGDGLLGSEIAAQSQWDVISRKRSKFDIRDEKCFSQLHEYDIVINCIACTDTYSDDREMHWNVNYKSVISLSNFCEQSNIKLVHISTDYVYSNSKDLASEDDIPMHANNWYSFSKLLGDCYVQLNSNNLVIRESHKKTPFTYDNAWINQIGNFDYVNVIASLIIQLIHKNASGLINVGTELKTMYDLATRTKYDVYPSLNTFAPANVSMNISKMKRILQ